MEIRTTKNGGVSLLGFGLMRLPFKEGSLAFQPPQSGGVLNPTANKVVFLTILFVLVVTFSFGQTKENEEAFLILCEAKEFHRNITNNGTHMYKEVRAMYFLYKERSSDRFIDLFEQAKEPEGKLYALVGLYLIGDIESYLSKKALFENLVITVTIFDNLSFEYAFDLFQKLENDKLVDWLLFFRFIDEGSIPTMFGDSWEMY